MPEEELVARVRDGDAHAFALLVQQYMNRATRFAFYAVGSLDVADDIVQNVYVQIWEHRAALDPKRPFKPYLFRAIRNRILNERKADAVRDRHRSQIQAEVESGALRANVPSPEGAILSAAMVQAALRQLPIRRQLALRLWMEEDLSETEIAHILETSLLATNRLIRRALADVRKILFVSK